MAGPTEPSLQPEWPNLLSQAVHELRNPLSVVDGYLRMLVNEQFGPLTEKHRHLLELCRESCARMSELLKEASQQAHFEELKLKFERSAVDIRRLLGDIIATLPDLPDRTVTVELEAGEVAQIQGDATHLKAALAAIVIALRREVVTSDLMKVRVERLGGKGTPVIRITVGEAIRMPQFLTLAPEELGMFKLERGNAGLSLFNARRVIEAHGGSLLAPLEGSKACAVISIPSI